MTSRVSDQTMQTWWPVASAAQKTWLKIALFGASMVVGFVPLTHAQVAPDTGIGGTLRNEIERSLTTPILPKIEPKSGPERPAEKTTKGETMVVSQFRFTGNTLVSDSALNRVVAPYLGRPVDFDDLQNAASLAALAYRERGFLATVSIPRQEIEDGVITLRVAEARYGGTRIDPLSDGRINSEIILERVERAMKLEKAINTNVLDRTVLLLNDLPGASVQAGLAEGKAAGETEVVLQSSFKPLLTGSVGADRHGSVSTGEGRELVDILLNSPAGRGEQYALSLMHSAGSRFGRAGFSAPVGSDGIRVGINGSYLEYQVIDGPQRALNLTGNSSSASIDVSYPFIRTQQTNLYVSGSYASKQFDNYAAQVLSRSYQTQVGVLSVVANWFDTLFKRDASNQVSIAVSSGRLGFNDSQSQQSDAATIRTTGAFQKLNLSIARSQAIEDGWLLYGSASAQIASKNLDSSEKLFLGGASGVRAYPTSEGGGNSGELYQIELRKRFSSGVELRLFHDEGRVRRTIDAYAGNPTPNDLHYSGNGVALIASLPRNVTLSFIWARRAGNNPNPITKSTGETVDQDGTKRIDRVWLAASMTF